MLKEIYLSLEDPHNSSWGWKVQFLIYATILVNLIALSLDTVKSLHIDYGDLFSIIEAITVSIFIIELALRYSLVGYNEKYKGFRGRLRFTFTFYTLVDIIAILPFILSLFGINSYFIRVLRLMRVFKLFHIAKASKFDRAIRRVFVDERENLIMLFAFIGIILLLLTITVYYAENSVQPDIYSSIPQTLWWSVVTLSTVGYGDMYPVTVLGRIATSILAMLGIAFYAIPGSLFTAAMIKEINENECNKE